MVRFLLFVEITPFAILLCVSTTAGPEVGQEPPEPREDTRVRMPPKLKRQLEALARLHGRSLNAEIVWVLGGYVANSKQRQTR